MKSNHVQQFDLSDPLKQAFVSGVIFNLNSPIESANLSKLHGEYWAYFKKPDHPATLVRDKMGVAPCYYFIYQNSLVVSNNLDELIKYAKLKNLQLTFNELYAQNLTKMNFSDQRSTLIKQIKRCPPGTKIEFLKSQESWIEKSEVYWDPLEQTEFLEADLYQLITLCIAERLATQEKVGLFISGGFDSSLIYSALTEVNSEKWQALALEFDPKSPAYENNLNYFSENIEKIKWSDEVAKDCFLSENNWPKTTLYSPGLAMFLPLFAKAKVLGSKSIWTGLGGDDIFTLPDIYFSKNILRKLLFFAKSMWNGNRGTLLQRALIARIQYSGAYSFGIECEQQVAHRYGLKMSYPLFDDRLYSWMLINKGPGTETYELGKPGLRQAWKNHLPAEFLDHLSPQDYNQSHDDLVKKSYGINSTNHFSFNRDVEIIQRHLQKVRELLYENGQQK